MVRPSYVLGGRAMEIVHEKSQLKKFVQEAFKVAEKNPILIDKFIDNAMEVDVDAISDGKKFLLQVLCNILKKLEFTQVTLLVACLQYQLNLF
jgi:carbamoylphosphate synthase large subunit